mgnify:CR=1 FL=1
MILFCVSWHWRWNVKGREGEVLSIKLRRVSDLWQTWLSLCQDFNYDCKRGPRETSLILLTSALSWNLTKPQLAWCCQSRASFKFLSLFDQKPRQVKERWAHVFCFAVVTLALYLFIMSSSCNTLLFLPCWRISFLTRNGEKKSAKSWVIVDILWIFCYYNNSVWLTMDRERGDQDQIRIRRWSASVWGPSGSWRVWCLISRHENN